jgi:hypothetical protein
MLSTRGLLGLGLTAGLLSCAPRAAVGERVAVMPMPTPAPPAPQIGAAFEPGSADPRQRQRLDQASSELDAHFQTKFAELRATAAMVGIVLGGELSYVRNREHGKCAPVGPLRPRTRTEGAFDLRCDRGEVEVSLLLAPGVPSSIQFASWKPKGNDAAEPGATCVE